MITIDFYFLLNYCCILIFVLNILFKTFLKAVLVVFPFVIKITKLYKEFTCKEAHIKLFTKKIKNINNKYMITNKLYTIRLHSQSISFIVAIIGVEHGYHLLLLTKNVIFKKLMQYY